MSTAKPPLLPTRKPFANVVQLEDEEEDDLMVPPPPTKATVLKKKKSRPVDTRRRRRSSARFLLKPFSADDDDDEDDEEESSSTVDAANLGDLYKRAIRMNAENRINAGNSWGLQLIEHMDKVLEDDAEESESKVNFTKASCTLDASVKIYSYRVDDVHLTSYKVLANLNRNDTQAQNKNNNSSSNRTNAQSNSNHDETNDLGDEDDDAPTRARKTKTMETLERNVANINIDKLDQAFDIDPLFHKMSKIFDEGGAKGLLLANLSISNKGCHVVFDSKDEEPEPEPQDYTNEGMMDCTALQLKLKQLLEGENPHTIPLVPGLLQMRHELGELQSQGFVDYQEDRRNQKKSRRYAASEEEELDAEKSIHQDALERSRMSMAAASEASDPQEFAADDFGGDDDDDDDFGFTDFINNDTNGDRYSSISFQNEPFVDEAAEGTGNLLNALFAAPAADAANDYEFFSQETLDRVLTLNDWAGSDFFAARRRKLAKKTAKTSDSTKKAKASKSKKKKKKASPINFMDSPPEDWIQNQASKSIQWSKAMVTKYSKESNLLPLDAGIQAKELQQLYMRPNDALTATTTTAAKKAVGFVDMPMEFGDDGMGFDDGDDDDGYDFGGGGGSVDHDLVVPELEGVRKVDKIEVGFATVAKKVDVKRLKKDLWTELETNFVQEKAEVKQDKEDDDEEQQVDDEEVQEDDEEQDVNEPLSFQSTVAEMETNKNQSDVTLPFYFICLLHLANEKDLYLESRGLEDFTIFHGDKAQELSQIVVAAPEGKRTTSKRSKKGTNFAGMDDDDE